MKAPAAISLILFGGSFGIISVSGLMMALNGYYTPGHSNAFSLLASTLTQALMVLGCGGLTGLRYVNFSVLPSVSKNMVKQTSIFSRVWNSNLTFSVLPLGFFLTSLTLVDSMTLYGAVPALVGFGLLATCTYLQALGL